MSFSTDGRHLAVGYFDGQVELWEVASRQLVKVLQEKASRHARVAFSPTADALAATAGPDVVKWHDLAAGTEKVVCKTPGPVRDLVFSQDGARLAILCEKKESVLLIDTVAGGDARTIKLPPGSVTFFNNARFSPDAARLYVSCGAFQQPKLRCISLPDGETLWEKDGRALASATWRFSAMALPTDALVTGTSCKADSCRFWNTPASASPRSKGTRVDAARFRATASGSPPRRASSRAPVEDRHMGISRAAPREQ